MPDIQLRPLAVSCSECAYQREHAMLCPYCISNIAGDAAKCAKCGREIPPLYRQYYPKGTFSKPPIIMSAVGFSAHGKTIYFASLLHVINSELTKVWPGF